MTASIINCDCDCGPVLGNAISAATAILTATATAISTATAILTATAYVAIKDAIEAAFKISHLIATTITAYFDEG